MKLTHTVPLAALLILGLVAGCSSNSSQAAQPGTNTTGTGTQQAPAPVTQQAPATATHQPPPTLL